MESKSAKWSLNKTDLMKIATGAGLAGSAAVLVYLKENSQAVAELFSGNTVLYALAVALVPVAINTLRKLVAGQK